MIKPITVSALLLSLVGLVACGSKGTPDRPKAPALNSCPRKGLSQTKTRNPEAQDHLVPWRPTSALLCRYRVSSKIVEGKPSFPTQVSERTIGGSDLIALTTTFNSLPRARSGAIACESGFPLHYLAVFHYRHAPQVYVRISYEGCGYVFNDPQHTVFESSPDLRAKLNSLLAE